MLILSAKIREILGKKTKKLRKEGLVPAVLYGQKIKEPLNLEVNSKEFEKILKGAGSSSLINLEIEGKKEGILVLIHDIGRDYVTGNPIHIDFYRPNLEEEIEAKVPLIFEGESLAVKDLGGTLVKNVSEVRVRAKPQNLPKEIKLAINGLNTFEDSVLIKDLQAPEGVRILGDQNNIVAFVAQPQKIEEELAKPVEEKVEEVEKVGQKKKEESATADVSAGKEASSGKEEKSKK